MTDPKPLTAFTADECAQAAEWIGRARSYATEELDTVENRGRLYATLAHLLRALPVERRNAVPLVDVPAPVPMVLHCPECRARHVDAGDFATKPHHTHSCQSCGLTWRPAVVPTVGVQFLPGFKDAPEAQPPGTVERAGAKQAEMCADCPIGGREGPGPVCPRAEQCDRECADFVSAMEDERRGIGKPVAPTDRAEVPPGYEVLESMTRPGWWCWDKRGASSAEMMRDFHLRDGQDPWGHDRKRTRAEAIAACWSHRDAHQLAPAPAAPSGGERERFEYCLECAMVAWHSPSCSKRGAHHDIHGYGPDAAATAARMVEAATAPLRAEIERLRGELEIEHGRLAAVGVLACSRNLKQVEGMAPEYDSASLNDVRKLVADLAAAEGERDRLREAEQHVRALVSEFVVDADNSAVVGAAQAFLSSLDHPQDIARGAALLPSEGQSANEQETDR